MGAGETTGDRELRLFASGFCDLGGIALWVPFTRSWRGTRGLGGGTALFTDETAGVGAGAAGLDALMPKLGTAKRS